MKRHHKLLIRPAGKRYKFCADTTVYYPSLHISMFSGIISVYRFQSSGKSSLIADQDLWLVNVSQCHIIKACCCQGSCTKRNVFLISAMCKKNMDSLLLHRYRLVIQAFSDLTVVIAESIHIDIQLRVLDTGQFSVFEKSHIGIPLKSTIKRITADKIMVSCHKIHSGIRNSRKQIIHFLKFSHKRLTVEQISGYK